MKRTIEELVKNLPHEEMNKLATAENATAMGKVISIITLLNKKYEYTFIELELITLLDNTYLYRLMCKQRDNMTIEYFEKFCDSLILNKKDFFNLI